MRNIWTIAKKEFRGYLNSTMAYVIALVIFIILGIYFYIGVVYAVRNNSYFAIIDSVLGFLVFPLLFIGAPAITMRSMAEEKRSGTLELMLTAPVRDWELVVGKWLGAFLLFLVIIAITLIYPLVFNQIVSPGIDQGAMTANYLGVILMTAALCAIGVMVSSWFSNQFAALFVSLGVVMLLWWFLPLIASFSQGALGSVLTYIGLQEHFYGSFMTGVIELKDLVYFISLTALALFFGSAVVEAKRWR